MNKVSFLLLISILACSQDNNTPQNNKPGNIQIESIDFNGKEVTIDWNDVIDLDDDIIYYKLFINSSLIKETTQSIATTLLDYNSFFEGKIFATDKNGGVSELSFSFESPKSKLLFFTIGSTNLYCFDLITKKLLWKGYASSSEFNTVFENVVLSGYDGLSALNILNGEIEWNVNPSNYQYSTEFRNIIVDNKNIYAFNAESDLYCVDIENKEKRWDISFLEYYAPLSMNDSKIFVCSRNDDHLYAINKVTGVYDWKFRLKYGYKIETNPLIDNDAIYFGDYYGVFYSLNISSGQKNWSFDVGRYSHFKASPTFYGNSIITGTNTTLYSINKNNGNFNWVKYMGSGGYIMSSPFIYEDKIYIGVSTNTLPKIICLNTSNGQLIWSYDLEAKTTTSPIVYEGIVYTGDWNNNIYAIDANTGSLKWTYLAPDIIFKSPTIVIGNAEKVIYPSNSGLKN